MDFKLATDALEASSVIWSGNSQSNWGMRPGIASYGARFCFYIRKNFLLERQNLQLQEVLCRRCSPPHQRPQGFINGGEGHWLSGLMVFFLWDPRSTGCQWLRHKRKRGTHALRNEEPLCECGNWSLNAISKMDGRDSIILVFIPIPVALSLVLGF